jgi:hypothetical protein
MDTRFWGPSGWRLLHLITFDYKPHQQKKAVQAVFETLPYVLPCKFCRYSLTDYMREKPILSALKSRSLLTKWLYTIHNMVNAKLRGQGITTEEDPPFENVQQIYEERLQAGCSRVEFEGWDFLFSVAENHPYAVHGSTPMPDAPPEEEVKGDEERNRWNYLKPHERIPYYIKFWTSLGQTLPFDTWRASWKSCHPRIQQFAKGAKQSKKELWRLRCCLEKKLDLVNRESFSHVCKRLTEHKSGCHKTKRARTCRARKTRKLR